MKDKNRKLNKKDGNKNLNKNKKLFADSEYMEKAINQIMGIIEER